ncbi:MAG: polymerase sigma factor RpoE, partial [Labilithrix sp.]|nr:polymerase sigma factor RpoE [Labilithrix sp.]
MSIDPDKPSRFAPLADGYKLSNADADRLLANIEARFAQESDAARSGSSSPRAGASAGSSGGKIVPLLGASCLALAIGAGLVFHASSETPAVGPVAMARRPASAEPNEPARAPESAAARSSVSIDDLPTAAAAPTASAKVVANDAKPRPVAMSTSTAVAAPASNETLERETRLLGDARQALKVGDGEKALAL